MFYACIASYICCVIKYSYKEKLRFCLFSSKQCFSVLIKIVYRR